MQNGAPPRRLVDHYAVLGVRPNATEDDITEAYLAVIEDADEATARRVERAVAVLTDPQQRAAYDRARAASRAGAPGRPPGPPPAAGAGNGATDGGPARTAPVATAPARRGNDQTHPPGGASPGQGNGTARTAGSRGGGSVPTRPVRPPGSPPQPAAPPPRGARAAAKSTTRRSVAYQQPARQEGAGRWLLALVPGVVLLVGIVVLAMVLGNNTGNGGSQLAVGSGGAAGAAAPAELVASAVEAPLVNGVQTLDVLVNGDTWRYEPNVIKVKKGLPVRFNLTAKGNPG